MVQVPDVDPKVIVIETPLVAHFNRSKESLTEYTKDATLSSTYNTLVFTICLIDAALLEVKVNEVLVRDLVPTTAVREPLP